jgi:hypothetical protein
MHERPYLGTPPDALIFPSGVSGERRKTIVVQWSWSNTRWRFPAGMGVRQAPRKKIGRFWPTS